MGRLLLIDSDRVAQSNINRQLPALVTTVGQAKVDVLARRIADINANCAVKALQKRYTPETAADFGLDNYDYVVDAIDTVTGKLALIQEAQAAGVPVISCMGAGNKLDPAAFRVADIYETSVCPLARVMRRELKKRGIERLKVVYSTEEAVTPKKQLRSESSGKVIPGSMAFVPGAAGLLLASEVVKDLLSGAGQ